VLGVGCWRWCATAGAELLKDLASNQILKARVAAAPPGLRPPPRLARYQSKLLDPVEDVVDGPTPYGD
jgi:hypothetical protein